jgi:hypothetical protein
MATTKISAEKTASEINILLSKHDVKYIRNEYDNGEIIGIAFIIDYQDKEIPFKLPIRWNPVLKAMMDDKHTPSHLCRNDQAKRVAWRQILRWIQAQLALVSVGMVDIKEIFMPYIMLSKGTLYEQIEKTEFKQIEQ